MRQSRTSPAGGPRRPLVLSGYFGFRNFGDEGILERLIATLRDHSALLALSQDPTSTRARFGIEAVGRGRILSRFCELRRSGGLVFGGGGLLKSPGCHPVGVGVVLLDVYLAGMLGRPVIMYGVGAGPMERAAERMFLAPALGIAQRIVVRDRYTLDCVNRWPESSEKTHLGADLLFSNAPESDASARDEWVGQGQNRMAARRRFNLGISLSAPDLHWYNAHHPGGRAGVLDGIARFVRHLASGREISVHLLGFQSGPGDQNDLRLLTLLRSNLGDCPVCWAESDLSSSRFVDALGTMKRCDFIIAMRYHAVVLASMAGVPFFALSYDEKVRNLIAELGVENRCFDLLQGRPSTLPDALLQSVSPVSRDGGLRQNVELMRLRARSGEEQLLAWLRETQSREPLSALKMRRRYACRALLSIARRGGAHLPVTTTLRRAGRSDSLNS